MDNKLTLKKTSLKFDKHQTNIVKGIALLLLLWHHLFYNDPKSYSKFVSIGLINEIPVECIIASFCKICVALFLFLSGYGLYKSYTSYLHRLLLNNSDIKKKNIKYLYVHIINLLSNYWFIFLIFVPMGLIFGRSIFLYYGINPLYYIADFLGVSYLFFEYDATMNVTWWYMSIIILFYLLFPLFYRIQKFSGELLLIVSIIVAFCPLIPEFRQIKIWLCPFIFGMYISENNIIERLSDKTDKRYKLILFSLLSICFLLYLRSEYFNGKVYIDFLLSLFISIFSFSLLSRIPIINKMLEELGKYSGQIFMFHTFIYSYYFKDFIYWFKYSLIIYIVMVIVCYLIARLLSWLMKVTRYNKLINKIISLCS